MAGKQNGNIKLILFFIIITAVFALVISFIYRKFIFDETLMPGRILCNQIMNAHITYYNEHGKYLVIDKQSVNRDLPLDARNNLYFSVFSTYPLQKNKQGISVFGSDKMQDYEIRLVFDAIKDKPQSLKNLKMEVVRKKSS